MLSTLGPGVLAGDRFTLEGSVDERASLVAAGQMATPVFAGASPSQTDAEWLIADGAMLELAFKGQVKASKQSLGGKTQAPGSYNAANAPKHFKGPGVLTVQ